jgi:TatD DNase family protein
VLIDSHTHLESFARRGEVAPVLARARAAGVDQVVTVGTSTDDWGLYAELEAASPDGSVRHTAGLHPCSVDERWPDQVGKLEERWRTGPTPVALGECGLDRFHLPREAEEAARVFAWQEAAFAAQLEIARRLGCPVVVHSRGAFRECVAQIDASGVDWARVVFHCFTEGAAEIAELSRRGGRGSFTGILTYKSAADVRAAARAQGLAGLMLETDAPYLTPVPLRGQPNEPAFLHHTAAYAAAEVFGVSLEELAAVTSANVRRWLAL